MRSDICTSLEDNEESLEYKVVRKRTMQGCKPPWYFSVQDDMHDETGYAEEAHPTIEDFWRAQEISS